MCNNIPQAKLSYALKCSLHMKDPDNYTLDEFIFYTYLFASTPSPPWKKASHGHKLFSGWCRRTFCLRKSGFTPLPRMLDEFFGRAKATGCWGWCLVISCFPVNGSPNMKQHSGKLIGSDDICLSNNWFKSTCCGCRTPKLSRPHLDCVSVANYFQEISNHFLPPPFFPVSKNDCGL